MLWRCRWRSMSGRLCRFLVMWRCLRARRKRMCRRLSRWKLSCRMGRGWSWRLKRSTSRSVKRLCRVRLKMWSETQCFTCRLRNRGLRSCSERRMICLWRTQCRKIWSRSWRRNLNRKCIKQKRVWFKAWSRSETRLSFLSCKLWFSVWEACEKNCMSSSCRHFNLPMQE